MQYIINIYNLNIEYRQSIPHFLICRGKLLEDVWLGHVNWPHVQWSKIWDGHDETQTETNSDDKEDISKYSKPPLKPHPRRGNALVYMDRPGDPILITLGGRTFNWKGYRADVWAFHLNTRTWEDLTPSGEDKGSLPTPRDHFNAIAYGKWVYMFQGRGGASYAVSKPLGDVWRFDTETRKWEEVDFGGKIGPPPRFLAMMSAYCSAEGPVVDNIGKGVSEKCPYGVDRVVVFGGETIGPKKSNLGGSNGKWGESELAFSGRGRRGPLGILPEEEDEEKGSLEGHEGAFGGCYLK